MTTESRDAIRAGALIKRLESLLEDIARLTFVETNTILFQRVHATTVRDVIAALRSLDAPVSATRRQEPVYWMSPTGTLERGPSAPTNWKANGWMPLYAAPVTQRPEEGRTEELEESLGLIKDCAENLLQDVQGMAAGLHEIVAMVNESLRSTESQGERK